MSEIFPRSSKPLLAFTSGDPAGIGPEATLKALAGARAVCRPLLVGEASVWKRAGWKPRLAPLFDTALGLKAPPYGSPSLSSGAASFSAVKAALGLAARGVVRGIVTAPISKQAWHMAGVPYTDHTEYLGAQTGGTVQMVLGIPKRRVWCVLATRHVGLADAVKRLSVSRVLHAAAGLDRALRRLGLKNRRLVLCGLNPHAGEEGLLGLEERRILIPAAAAAREAGIDLSGPVAADAAWRLHSVGRYDGVVALYHDQALIPLKMAGGLGVVNWTLGSLVRTSPGHGTGFDIAGKGVAQAEATIAAAELAAKLCSNGKMGRDED